MKITIYFLQYLRDVIKKLGNESIYINTKTVNVGNNISYNSTNLFFIFVELFFLKYMNYKNAIEGEKDS